MDFLWEKTHSDAQLPCSEFVMEGVEFKTSAPFDDKDAACQEKCTISEPDLWQQDEMQIDLANTFDDSMVVVNTPSGKAHFSCPRSIPRPSLWPHRPILVRESNVHLGHDSKSENPPVPVDGTAYKFETSLFKGEIMIRVRGLEGANAYFEGKTRLSSVVISGQFKKELPFESVVTGQEFCKKVAQPSMFVSKPLLAFFRMVCPLLSFYIGNQSYALSPLAQTAQCIQVGDDKVELVPDMEIEENFFSKQGKQLSNAQRKKYFSSKTNLKNNVFKCDKVYTFDFYNDKIDLETFELLALGKRFDVQKVLQAQPLRLLSRVLTRGDASEMYLWNFELWHEKATKYMETV